MNPRKAIGFISTSIVLTDEERRNGWTPESLQAYREERERATDLVGGYVITPFARPKQEPDYQHGGRWSPLKRKVVR